MCIIVAKPRGVKNPSNNILKTCFENNPDGAGFMYTKGNKVYIEKGFMSYNKFKKALNELKDKIDITDTSIVYHFRISTQGGVNESTCHPFPITDNVDNLRKTENITDVGIAHNGVIGFCKADKLPKDSIYLNDKNLSDTQIFIMDYLYALKINGTLFDKQTLKLIQEATNSKFAVLDNKGEITYIGKFIQENGIFYSNDTYQYSYRDYYKYYKKYVKNSTPKVKVSEKPKSAYTDYFGYYDEIDDNTLAITDTDLVKKNHSLDEAYMYAKEVDDYKENLQSSIDSLQGYDSEGYNGKDYYYKVYLNRIEGNK